MSALVVALTGTDHHQFQRMVEWVDAAAKRLPDVRFVVQHGATSPPLVAEGQAFFASDELTALLSEASAVVCHGGPGSIMDAREAGHVPLCVPRDPRLGEHVDGHQMRFAALVGEAGVVRVVMSAESFNEELDLALTKAPDRGAARTTFVKRDAARARVAAELDHLLSLGKPRPGRVRRSRRPVGGAGVSPTPDPSPISGPQPVVAVERPPEPRGEDAAALSPPRTALTG